jgi:hypothetical protein
MLVEVLTLAEPESSPPLGLVERFDPERRDGEGVVVAVATRGYHGGHQQVDEFLVRLQHRAVVDDLPQLGSLLQPLYDHLSQGRIQRTRVLSLSLLELDEMRQAQPGSEREFVD